MHNSYFLTSEQFTLIGHITKSGTGITIQGDYFDLQGLYQTIHEIAGNLQEGTFANNQLMGSAYEIRKANQGSRDVADVTPFNDEPTILYKGTNLILINFLPTLKTLRHYMAYVPTNKSHHASIYALYK